VKITGNNLPQLLMAKFKFFTQDKKEVMRVSSKTNEGSFTQVSKKDDNGNHNFSYKTKLSDVSSQASSNIFSVSVEFFSNSLKAFSVLSAPFQLLSRRSSSKKVGIKRKLQDSIQIEDEDYHDAKKQKLNEYMQKLDELIKYRESMKSQEEKKLALENTFQKLLVSPNKAGLRPILPLPTRQAIDDSSLVFGKSMIAPMQSEVFTVQSDDEWISSITSNHSPQYTIGNIEDILLHQSFTDNVYAQNISLPSCESGFTKCNEVAANSLNFEEDGFLTLEDFLLDN